MASRQEQLRTSVRDLYEARSPGRANWADWLYEEHVFVVAKKSRELAEKYGANQDLAEAAALLHDIADAKMKRDDPNHETESLVLAGEIMTGCGFSDADITLVVDDAIRYHSCHGNKRPESLEGKILATADSYAHLCTNFYLIAIYRFAPTESFVHIKEWVLKKLERDYHSKILFDDEKIAWADDYQTLKELFSR